MGRISACLLLAAVPAQAALDPIDRVVLEAEVDGHIPAELATVSDSTRTLELEALGLPVQGARVGYGIGVTLLASEILLRTGYRFARGDLPQGSVIDSLPAESYAFDAVPVTAAWQATLLPYRFRLLVGAEAGGQMARLSYRAEENLTSGWTWRFELSGRLGVHADILPWLGVRLFAQARWAQPVAVTHAPTLDLTGVGFGLSVAANFDRPKPGALSAPKLEEDEDLLRDYDSLGPSRLDEAFALIREGDEKRGRRDYIAAEDLYRRAVKLLPRDALTRRNVEAPVRIDWAACLKEIGRAHEAKTVLEEALKIDPQNARARAALRALGAP
ncbi:MAG: hypothetical protein HYZ27_00505 [Deltaproteobacteria bacterium]|nr:hypothetical protein [Deltaproteobacteria bacterium]